MFKIQINNIIEGKLKFTAALLTAAWMSTGICAQHASASQAPATTAQTSAKSKTQAKKRGKKRAKLVRSRKNNAAPARDTDADVLAQVLASDNKSPLWGRSGQ